MGNPVRYSKKLADTKQIGIHPLSGFNDPNGGPAMRATLILPLILCALAGCGSEATDQKSADEVIAEASKMARPLPGLYETTAQLREFSMPGVPAAQLEMMKKRFAANAGRTSNFCLTKAQAESGFEDMVRQMGEAGEGVKCSFSRFDAAGAKLDAALNCTGPGGMNMAMNMDGTLAPDRSDMTMTMKNSSSMMPGMEMTMVMQSQSKRIGECPA